MDRFFDRLRPFIRQVVRHAGKVLLGALLLSALSVYFALNLRIDTDFANLIPESYPSVQAIERLRETVGGESEVAVGIESQSFEANKAFAEALIPRAMALQGEQYDEPYFTRVEYRKEVSFLENNALYFATSDELAELETYLDDKREASIQESNPFFFDLELDDEEEEADTTATKLQAVYDDIVSTEYPISVDSLTMVLKFFPAGSQTNVGFIEDAYTDLEALIAEMEPTSYDPAMEVTTAGRLYRQLTELRAVQRDVLSSFAAGVTTVLLFVIFYFFYKAYRARAGRRFVPRILLLELARLPLMAVLIGLPLLMSLSWTFGLAYLAFGQLNLMTSTLGLVLFGLGIDYGIHFYARYTEERGQHRSVLEAAEITFTSTGQAITVGALTTAMALYVLTIADFKGFSEFGFIAGTGIIFALIGMTVVMPALLALFERWRFLNLDVDDSNTADSNMAGTDAASAAAPARSFTPARFPAARAVVGVSVLMVVAALVFLPRVEFQFQFGELEPTYEEYNARREVIRKVFNDRDRRNPAYIVVDDADEVPPIMEALEAKMAADTLSPTIRSFESLQDRFPLESAKQQEKLARIAAIRELLNDPLVQEEGDPELERLRQAAQTTEPIAMEQVPEFLRERFTSKSGEMGNFVIIYPSVGLSDGRLSMAFAEDVGSITTEDGTTYHAGSTSLVAADMLRLMLDESPWMIAATFIIVVALMWLNFMSVRWALLATIPLIVGVLWMLLTMELFALKLNFYNLIVLPAVLGIGNDAGVHLVHRYRELGPGSIRKVLRTTGEHVAMGSLTTMIGFAGLLLSFHPGIYSIGELAVVGIGAALIAALLFLPAMLQWLEDNDKLHAVPAADASDVAVQEAS